MRITKKIYCLLDVALCISVDSCCTTQCHIPENNLVMYCHENLKSDIVTMANPDLGSGLAEWYTEPSSYTCASLTSGSGFTTTW